MQIENWGWGDVLVEAGYFKTVAKSANKQVTIATAGQSRVFLLRFAVSVNNAPQIISLFILQPCNKNFSVLFKKYFL